MRMDNWIKGEQQKNREERRLKRDIGKAALERGVQSPSYPGCLHPCAQAVL